MEMADTSCRPAVRGANPTTAGRRRAFERDGYLVLRQFVDAAAVARMRTDIETYRRQQALIQVRWLASTFDTFNGRAVADRFPDIHTLYEQQVLQEVARLQPGLAVIDELKVGLSVNVMPTGGRFQPHFDRNRMTAVLYLNDDFDGGEMCLHPRLRYWLGAPGWRVKARLQRLLDRFVRRPAYLQRYGRPVSIRPGAGDLLIFEGVRTYHAVAPVTAGNERISVQFAYDRPGASFDISAYYGK